MKTRDLLLPYKSAVSPFSAQLAFAIERVEALNQYRIKRAFAANQPYYRHVFQLIPILIHLNEPELPGYVENAPAGIAHFSPNHYQQRFITALLPQAKLAKHLEKTTAFDALYSMGSTGSITQTQYSDLDLWLCYPERLSAEQLQLMEQKIARLCAWAKGFEVDVNIYLMNPARFSAHLDQHSVSEEHSGSSQHFFLLDEFYRSAIRLAGKRLLWLHLTDEQYQQRHHLPEIDMQAWVDFGDFSALSTAEFFGASLWQLYKGIDNPYKSAIKIVLLESYAHNYPQTALISKSFKQKWLSKTEVRYHFDPYLAMLDQVSEYLIERKEFARLNRIRQCFYLKAMEGENEENWRTYQLQQLAKSWEWQEEELEILNQRASWKTKQVKVHHQMLVDLLLQSYRNLIQFARKFHIDPSIMASDIDILMRKLYSVFEVLPGKVTLLNPRISQNLAEKNLTFIEGREGSMMKPGWYLLNQAPSSEYENPDRFVEYQKDLTKLVAWAYFNGILTAESRLHVVSRHVSLLNFRQFITDLRISFPTKGPIVGNEELLHPNEIRHLIFAVNLTVDPTEHIKSERIRKITQADLFNFGGGEAQLIGSVDIIYRNMWNEIRTQHVEGKEALLKALKFLSNKIYRGSAPPQSVNVFCYSKKLRLELRESIAELVDRCISIHTGTVYDKTIIEVQVEQEKHWGFIFEEAPFALFCLPQAVNLDEDFAKSERDENAVYKTRYPKVINDFASEGFLQFFFEDNVNGLFNVYILDEQNKLESYFNCLGSKEEKVKEINRFYAKKEEREWGERFNFPQYYQLIELSDNVQIVPFQSKQHREYQQRKQQKA